jgi:hypothetical protein
MVLLPGADHGAVFGSLPQSMVEGGSPRVPFSTVPHPLLPINSAVLKQLDAEGVRGNPLLPPPAQNQGLCAAKTMVRRATSPAIHWNPRPAPWLKPPSGAGGTPLHCPEAVRVGRPAADRCSHTVLLSYLDSNRPDLESRSPFA